MPLTWYGGEWHEEPVRLTGPGDHAFWMSTSVFDGARAFDGMMPDLDRHCARLLDSARGMMLAPDIDVDEIVGLCLEGVERLDPMGEIYIRPMFFARQGFVMPDPASTEFTIILEERPMPAPKGTAVCFSQYRRPARDAAPTDIKAGCLYPNLQRALFDATGRGFDNCITFDPSGNVAELASANLWIVKDGVALTPHCNGTFLNGITRQRLLALFAADGVPAREVTLTRADVMAADELFSSGNYGKVMPITRVEDRHLQPGPVYKRARELYWDFSSTAKR
jgi:branched-chain amino acid aminotransferase